MATFRTGKIVNFILNLDPLSKVVFISLAIASTGLVIGITYKIINQLSAPHLTLAAGDENGESYIISQAIKQVVERKSNINMEVKSTGGTTDNLLSLDKGEAQLATAQADVAAGNINISSARTIAVLYQDLFQLVVKDPTIKQFPQLKGKIIALSTEGGQYKSFLKVAAHYGMSEKDFNFTGSGKKDKYKDKDADNDFKNGQADALFRVRAAGNKSISEHIQKNQGRLLAIEQAEAMKIKYPTFEVAKIPLGAYRGDSPVPEKDLDTVAVSRLLLTTDKIDQNVIQQITRILSENRQEIANAIAEKNTEVKPLLATIDRPSITSSAGITLHPGALAFYERDKRSFIQENSDFLAFVLTMILLGVEWIKQLKLWIARGKKDEADEYIESTIKLMNEGLGEVEFRQQLLDEAFNTAAKALFAERISQESFRTFNEAYKTTREAIERERQLAKQAVENKQRELSTKYIKAVVQLLQDTKHSKNILQEQLDKILVQVAKDLVVENISQESFRTFIEAYKTTRDAIERKI